MTEPDRGAFQTALSDFTFEAACGAAIRHLADSGCTAKQIMERLDYPISGERVRKALYKHLCDTGVILEESPEEGFPEAKPEYVLEYDSYGKPSYRRKNTSQADDSMAGFGLAGATWTEAVYRPANGFPEPVWGDTSKKIFGWIGQGMRGRELGNSGRDHAGKTSDGSGKGAELSAFLSRKCNFQKGETAYLSCDFGIPDSIAARGISLLNGKQREYLEGILWPCRRVYHRMDHRMKEILCSLYEQYAYEGICYFMLRREKLYL
ncbi:MAG: hypothetical protein NC420_01010 [Eubacterium sp.]|nr:hypothetical protein [Eubacterium sp.]MCM1213840.1 hypothetical protein [Lachnospiraceae bacterium]MCM1303290.1 hypothetical protein [Butyrivibrio sp.]MCM1343123.1 hypothetical protein [Muribaculaceae bacterium]MCM1237960.1 hypothetical protein [Lachnospiraceae bacterium]